MPHREPKVWEWRPGDNSGSMYDAIRAKDEAAVGRFLRRNPDGLRQVTTSSFADTWVHYAVYHGSLSIVDRLLAAGLTIAEVNASYGDGRGKMSVLEIAARSHPGLVGPLLERGADPHLGRPVISALNHEDEEQALRAVQALVAAGVDVNRVYPLYGSLEHGFTALEFSGSKPTVTAYLRTAGAIDRPRPARAAGGDPAEEVVAYFEREFGPVDPRSLTEIVPTTEPPIRVHVVRPNPKSDCITLFTTGLSTRAMAVPDGAEAYRFAEMFAQLPAGWPLGLGDMARPEHGWPVAWLRTLAGAPHADGTWLGGGYATVATADPPEPFTPGLPFTVAWLLAERCFERSDGETVQLYRLVPITTPEWRLLQRDGPAALGAVLDAAGVQVVIAPDRRSVVG